MAIWTPTLKPKAKQIKKEGCLRSYDVEIPPLILQEAIHNVLIRLQLQARISGFRPGKAPLDIIKRKYAPAAKAEAAENVIKRIIPDLLKDLKLKPVIVPSVTQVKMPNGQPLKFRLDVEIGPIFSPQNYKGIPILEKRYPVVEGDINSRLKQLQEGNARLEKTQEEKVSNQHYVIIDFQLTRDGKVLKGGNGKQELVDMSSDQTIEGLTEGLLGAKRQESRKFSVKFNNAPAECQANVVEIKKKILPELDDDFAKDMGVDTLEKLREEITKIIEKENSEKTEREISKQINDALLKENVFSIPPTLAKDQLERMMERLRVRLSGNERPLPEKEAKDLREKLKPEAANQVRLQFILSEIAAKEKVNVSDDDFKLELASNLEKSQSDEEKKKTNDFFSKRETEIRSAMLESKVIKMIRESAKVKKEKE